MLLRAGDDLGVLGVYAVGLEQKTILGAERAMHKPVLVAEFHNPVLLTDNARIGRMRSGLRDTVQALYQSFPRRVEHLGVGVDWDPVRHPGVWCPSIDTLFFARTLAKGLGEGVVRAAEIGCGSGFLSKLALAKARGLQEIWASDISEEALDCTRGNLGEGAAGGAKVRLLRPAAGALGLEGQFDLIFSNPPYIPRPGEHDDNPYEGLGLVASLAARGSQHLAEGGRLLLNLSSLAGWKPVGWFEAAGWEASQLDEMRVPLKVNPVVGGLSGHSRAWRAYLEAQGLVEVDAEETSGYRYWHRLRMFEFRRR